MEQRALRARMGTRRNCTARAGLANRSAFLVFLGPIWKASFKRLTMSALFTGNSIIKKEEYQPELNATTEIEEKQSRTI